MLYDSITLTHEDIILLSVLVDNQIRLDSHSLSSYGAGSSIRASRSKNEIRLKKNISALLALQNKLKSIKSVTYKN